MSDKPLITHMYTADPSAHVYNGKIFIYPSHDRETDNPDNDNGDQYDMVDYHVFSMDKLDGEVTDHGIALDMKDVPWVSKQMWAPDIACKNGKYYFYFPARDKDGIFRLGVAVGDQPQGPFTPEAEPMANSYSIDPCTLVDDDNEAYLCWGGLWGGQLQKWPGNQYDPNGEEPADDQPAIGPRIAKLNEEMTQFSEEVREIQILDENGEPLKAGDHDRRYFEGPWLHKHNGKYYLSYSTGNTHYLVYAEGDNPYGPFTYKGRILEPVIGWTTHHSIVKFEDKWLLFYHDCSMSNGVNHLRCVKVHELNINEAGEIETVQPYA